MNNNDWKGSYGRATTTRVYKAVLDNNINAYIDRWFEVSIEDNKYKLFLLL